MLTRTKSAVAIAAAAMMLSVGAHAAPSPASDASASGTPGTPGAAPHEWGPHHPGGPRGPHGGPGGPGFAHTMDQLHDRLKLDAQQEKAWQQAQAISRQNFETMRTTHEVARRQFRDQAAKPILDLGALEAQREQVESSDRDLRAATTKAFLAFYDGLNDKQKKLVSDDIKRHWRGMMRPAQGRPGADGGPPPHDGAQDGGAPPPPPSSGAPSDAPPPAPAQ